MKFIVTKSYFPQVKQLGETFKINLRGEIVRAGIDPASGAPAIWTAYVPTSAQEELVERVFVVLTDDMVFEDKEASSVAHRGMWWEADTTFHLVEIFVWAPPGDNET